MFKFPRRLCVIQRRRVACELELLHHFLGATISALEQERDVNLKLEQLRSLVFVATGCLGKEVFEPLTRLRVILFLEWNLREVVLSLPEFWIELQRFLESRLSFIEFLLLHQNLTAKIYGRRLISLGPICFVDKLARGHEIALLESLLGLLKSGTGKGLVLRRAFGRCGYRERSASLSGLFLQPPDLVQRFGEKLVQLRREILFGRSHPVFR